MKEKEAIVVALEEQTNNVQEENSVVEEEVQIRNSPLVHSCAACVLVLIMIWKGTLVTSIMKSSVPSVNKYFPTGMLLKGT